MTRRVRSHAGRAPTLVSIVGAGPGHPDLLTWLAVRRLRRADVVYYDGLVPDEVARVATRARLIRVSRRVGEREIAPAEVAAAIGRDVAAKRRVVRLRAGDPFVLARGAEEALALAAADVPFEVIPGLTTAAAAPALAGIPLTHRGVASGFVVVSGHAPSAYEPVIGHLPANAATIVVLMGIAERAAISTLLVRAGWREETTTAVIADASHASQRTWLGTLRGLGEDEIVLADGASAVIVIGDVVEVGLSLAAGMRPLRLGRPRATAERDAQREQQESEDTQWPQ